MEDALQKSLPDLVLVKSPAPLASRRVLRARLCFETQGMKAQAFLSCTEDFLQMTCPLPRMPGGTHSEDIIKDWLGELGNLILGRLKNRLFAHDVTIKISAPDFADHWPRTAHAETIALWFRCGDGLIGFDCAIEGRVPEIGEARPQSAEILPGDAIYRLNDTPRSGESSDILSQIRSGVEHPDISVGEEEPDHDSPETERSMSLLRSSAKPFPMHFHNRKESTVKLSPGLSGLSWPSMDRLQLKFSSGFEITVSPTALLEQGLLSFEIEEIGLQIVRENDLVRINVPKLQITMSRILRQAG